MKGVCFKEPLFHKAEDGTKTMTRRLINPQPDRARHWNQIYVKDEPMYYQDERGMCQLLDEKGKVIYPRYTVGEVAYLKEPYVDDLVMDMVFYRYNRSDIDELRTMGYAQEINAPHFWKSKLSMPAVAARYFVKFTAVRAERLQEITDEDCIKEGVMLGDDQDINLYYHNHVPILTARTFYLSAKEAFADLIDSISGKGTWDSNPFVWVYEFELIEEPKQ